MARVLDLADALNVVDLVADNPQYNSERYEFKSLLVKECPCDDWQTLRYGKRADIKQLCAELCAIPTPDEPDDALPYS